MSVHVFIVRDGLNPEEFKKAISEAIDKEKATVATDWAGEPLLKRFHWYGDGMHINTDGAYVYYTDYVALEHGFNKLDAELAETLRKLENATGMRDAFRANVERLSKQYADLTQNRDDYRKEYLRRCEQLEAVEKELAEYKVANTGLLNRIDEQREALTKLQDERDDEATSTEYHRGLCNYWYNAHQRLERHVKRMQHMATAYLEPGTYTDRNGEKWHGGTDGLRGFAGDMIYMLDGPEQREAMSAVGVPREHIELVKHNEELEAAIEVLRKANSELASAALEREPVMTINTVGDITQTDVFEHAPVGSGPEHKAVFECTFEWARDNWDLLIDQTVYRYIHDAGNGSPAGYIKIVTTD